MDHFVVEKAANCCRTCVRLLERCRCGAGEQQPVYWETEMVMIDPYDGGTFAERPALVYVPRSELEALYAEVARLRGMQVA